MKRTLIIVLILVAVIGVGVSGYLLLTPDEYKVSEDPDTETIEVAPDTIIATVNASARLQALDTANANFDVAGTVDQIHVEEGDTVSAGDLVADLDLTDLQDAVRLAEVELERSEAQLDKLLTPPTAIDIDSAEAALDSAKANLAGVLDGPNAIDVASAEMGLESAKANLQRVLDGPNANSVTVAAAGLRKAEIALAQAQFAYDEVSWDSRAATAQGANLQQATIDYETALANFNLAVKQADAADILAAQAQVSNANATLQRLLEGPELAQIAAAEAQVIQAEASLQKLLEGASEADVAAAQSNIDAAALRLEQAQRNLDKAQLFSPIDGTVSAVNIKEGESSATQGPAIVVSDLSAFKMNVDIDEIDINEIAVGQPVIITLDSLQDEEFFGVVDAIAVAPVAGAAGGIVAYPVTVIIDSDEAAPFKIGMNVNATIETDRLEDVLVVPNRAIQIDREDGKTYVDLVVDDQHIERTEVELGRRGAVVSEVVSGLNEGDLIAIIEASRREQLRQMMGGEG